MQSIKITSTLEVNAIPLSIGARSSKLMPFLSTQLYFQRNSTSCKLALALTYTSANLY